MKIILVVAKFNKRANQVYESRRNSANTEKKAFAWLGRMSRLKVPSMFYLDGSFATETPQFCENYFYKREYQKVRD